LISKSPCLENITAPLL